MDSLERREKVENLVDKGKRIRKENDKRDKDIVLHYKKVKDDFDKIVSEGRKDKKSYSKISEELEESNVPQLNGEKWTGEIVEEIILTLGLYKMLK